MFRAALLPLRHPGSVPQGLGDVCGGDLHLGSQIGDGVRGLQHPVVGADGEFTSSTGRWVERARRRYLAAVKALAHVWRLRLPGVQVTIGDQQVNVVG
jgi:hypothetical protein